MSHISPPQASIHPHRSIKVRTIAIAAWLWKLIWWVWCTVIVGGFIVSVIVSYATTGTSGFKNPDPRSWFIVRPLLAYPWQTAFGLFIALILTLGTYLAYRSQQRQLPAITNQLALLPSQLNRQRLLAKVRAFWINGVLEQSLYGRALIALGLHEQSDAVANPWRLVFQQPNRPARPLAPGTRITQVYDDVSGELLILGEPGSGKTTLLLELARDLLNRAQQDDAHPIPVVFNLSSWAIKRQNIGNWLVEELNDKYQVPRSLGQSLIDTDQLLLLFDGLDEVNTTNRTACIEAINAYRQEHGLVPIVVCSRSFDYLTLETRILLQSAVIVQALTGEQIDDYLSSAGEQLASVREALRNDQVLQELLTTPLMLSILTLAYQGMSAKNLLTVGISASRQKLLETYTQRMLPRRSKTIGYTPEQTLWWLSWLAHQLNYHSQTEFYIERMQADWLPGNRLYLLYRGLVTRLLDGLVFGLIGGLIYKLLSLLVGGQLTVGLLVGLLCVLIGKLDTKEKPIEVVIWSWLRRRRSLRNGLIHGLIVGLTFGMVTGLTIELIFGPIKGLLIGLISGLIVWLSSVLICRLSNGTDLDIKPQEITAQLRVQMRRYLVDGLVFGLILGLLFGLSGGPSIGFLFGLSGGFIYGVVCMLDEDRDLEIKPAEVINWSWTSMGQHLIQALGKGLGIGLAVGLVTGLIIGLVIEQITGLLIGLLIGLVIGLVAGLVRWVGSGLSSEMLEARNLVRPNQGIWQSARNGIFIALIIGSVMGLIFGPIVGLIFRSVTGLAIGLIGGATVGIIIGFQNGGRACFKHITLRLLLWWAGCIPLIYPRFLDYTAERILLRKIGGGYIFIHRVLLEYFAELDPQLLALTRGN